ncbi:MAG: alcohol dehydrogenase catalytic domain-containing protein [Eubacteriales bacterium]|nr:alcohol dehydrogenase catalytic domain-containing protein [Eubacteriales bacterium]
MLGKMKAKVFHGVEDMRLEILDIPQIAKDEVLVKVRACGVCGSDISYYFGRSPLDTPDGKGPLVLGHEIAGDIVEVGSFVQEKNAFKVGDRVALNPVMPCNACRYCKKAEYNLCQNGGTLGTSVNGGFAEYVKVSYTNVFKLSDNVSYAAGALTEPLACAAYGMKNLDIQLGDNVVIIGPGTIGLMMTQIGKNRGAGNIILCGVIDWQLEQGKKLGADHLFNTLEKDSPYYTPDIKSEVKKITDGFMAERVIVPTNAMSAIRSAVALGGGHSTIVFFGLPSPDDKLEISLLEAIQSDRIIKFSWLTPLVWPSVVAMLNANLVTLDSLVTHTFKLEDVEKGIQFMCTSKENKIKGVMLID